MSNKILVIEDNRDVRENLAELLELSGYEVITAENGKIGVKLATDESPDLIICDIMMPEMDGFSVLRVLGHQASTMHIPFIFLTAKTEKEDFRKGMGLGADDYITKPFDDVQLLDTVEIRLKKSARIRQVFDKSEQGLQHFINEARAEKEMEKLSENKEIRNYQKRDVIYQHGQYPKWLYFVVSGSVKTFQINEFGKELITQVYKKGDFFGYIPLLKNEVHHDYASAIEDSVIRLIPPDDFSLLLLNNREVAAKFIKMLANYAEETERQLIELAYSSVRKRVANALLKFHDIKDSSNMAILRDDIANMAGSAKETIIRTLSDFKHEGLISIDENRIKLLNVAKLKNMPQ